MTARCHGQVKTWDVDRVIGNVGYTPYAELYRELQIHECYASLGPMSLATALLKRYPDLAVIVSPSVVGIVAAARAVEAERLTRKVLVTGLGFPSQLAGHVASGTVKSFAMWTQFASVF